MDCPNCAKLKSQLAAAEQERDSLAEQLRKAGEVLLETRKGEDAKDGLPCWCNFPSYARAHGGRHTQLCAMCRAALTPPSAPAKACCVDGDDDPDSYCVFDPGHDTSVDDCTIAKKLQAEGKGRNECAFWKVPGKPSAPAESGKELFEKFRADNPERSAAVASWKPWEHQSREVQDEWNSKALFKPSAPSAEKACECPRPIGQPATYRDANGVVRCELCNRKPSAPAKCATCDGSSRTMNHHTKRLEPCPKCHPAKLEG